MADEQPRGRGRARGRARGVAAQPQAQSSPSAAPSGSAGRGVRRAEEAGAAATSRAGLRTTTSDLSKQMGQLAVAKGSGESQSSSGNGNGNGNGNGASAGRGSLRGRRVLPPERNALALVTRPKAASIKKGSAGKPLKLTANYFKLKRTPNWCLFHHHVSFNPAIDHTGLQKALIHENKEKFKGGYLCDGRSLWTVQQFCKKEKPQTFTVQTRERPGQESQKIQVTITLTGQLDPADYVYIQVYNIIMRSCLKELNMQIVGRNYYDAAAKIRVSGHDMELWPGYITSIKQAENDLLMSVEISFKVMRVETAWDFMQTIRQNTRGGDFRKAFDQEIIGCTVLTDYNNRTYRVDDVDYNVTPNSRFSKRDGSTISYKEYYQTRYGLDIRHMDQPLLVSKTKARERRAGQDQILYLVPELCRMTGLTDDMRNNFNLMREMAKYTRVDPGSRIDKLYAFRNRLLGVPQVRTIFHNWNMELENQLVSIDGRQLLPETVVFKNKECSAGNEADWTKDMRSAHMFVSNQLLTWVVICSSKSRRDTQNFVDMLIKAGSGMSFKIQSPEIIGLDDDRTGNVVNTIERVYHDINPQLIYIVSAQNRIDRYSSIKRKCIIDLGVPSQVMLAKNLNAKGAMSIATKIAIQMNAKLGGIPWTLKLPSKTLMVVGYDVCHDARDKRLSFSATVMSLDQNLGRYYSSCSKHEHGSEVSAHFGQDMSKGLMEYMAVNSGALPTKIIIFRDGVGEGQIRYVYETEVKSVLEQVSQVYQKTGQSLNVAFIIVTKKINTRIFANKINPPPGTIVDDVITDPTRYDYFLVSQCVRQGTVSPTHYNVIEDTTGLAPDHIQRITYKLTHMYYNWSGTVTVPAPCQYAHKLAFLSSQALHQEHANMKDLLYFL